MFSRTSKNAPLKSPERRRARIEKRRRFWRKTRKVLLWTLGIGVVAHLSLSLYASVQLNRELNAIRQSGDPIRFSELEPPTVADSQNAALVYAQATKALHLSPEEKYAMLPVRQRSTPQLEKLWGDAVRHNQQALELTRQGAAMPQCRFPLDWQGDPTQLRFPYYSELRTLAKMLAQEAPLKAKSGDGAGALRDVRALFGISHHLSKEPFLIGYLVAVSINGLAHHALAQTLQQIPLTVAQAHTLEGSLPQDDWARAFRQSLVAERTIGIFVYESLGQAKAKNENEHDFDLDNYLPVWTSYPLLWLARPVVKLDEVQTLRLWRIMLDSPESRHIPRSITFSRTLDNAIDSTPFYSVLTRTLFPVFNRAGDNRDRVEVMERQREVALALTAYRTVHGQYPARLQDVANLWGSPLPLDLYSQKPFVYRRTGKGFVLYSIGVNRKDEGGKNNFTKGYVPLSSADDIVWLSSED